MPLNKVLLAASFLFFFTASCAFASNEVTIDLEATLEHVEARLAADPDDLQLIFTRGMLLAELGQYGKAADAFRKMLSHDPDLLRPRLELARVLMLSGNYYGARYNFEQVLKHDLPDEVQNNVTRMLARIREELPSFDFVVELISDSNPKQATSIKEVEIDGLLFKLDDDARASRETGLRFLLDGRVPFGDPSLWFIRGQFEHLAYGDRDLDFSYLQLAGGRHFPRDKHTLSLEAGYHWSRYQNEALYRGAIWRVSDFRSLRRDLFLRLDLSGMQLKYPDYSFRDGWQYTASSNLTYIITPRSRLNAGIGYTINRADESIYSFDQPFLSLRYVYEWPYGWITGANFRLSHIKYKDDDPFFRETRREREVRVEADVLNRRLSVWRFSPRLTVGHVDRDSNIDFFSWKRTYVRLGMTAEF